VLISVEGVDGAGKTTLVAGLAAALDDVVVLREPGGAVVSERIRDVLTDPALDIDPRTEALLYGAARGLGVDEVRALNAFGTGGLTPDRTLLLRVDPDVARARISGRAADRLEREGPDFFAAIAAAYDALAAAEPGRIVVIDAGQPPAAVLSDALAAL
jgi:dTMP kinase